MYSKVLLYYFSGTGNAKRVTEWISENVKTSGIPIEITNIENCKKVKIEKTEGKKLIGIISPTHGFNIPPLVLYFIFKFPRVKNADFFMVNTRAGMKLSKLFLPGLSGLAQILPAIVFFFKGFSVKGLQPIDLPSNWISIHPGLKQKVVTSMFERIKMKIDKFSGKMLQGKRSYVALYSLPFDLALIPISIGYFFMGRFMLSKTFIATSKCTTCGLCVKQCPVQALEMKSNRPYWSFDCESCMRCMNNCPSRAIETPHLFITLIWIVLLNLPWIILTWVFEKFGRCNCSILWYEELIYNALQVTFTFLFAWLTYYLLYKFMRFKFVDIIIRYSSFTNYKFWRRYKAPKNKLKSDNQLQQ